METFKINFNPSQIGSFARLLNLQFSRTFHKLNYENYVEYYNLRSVLKKCFDKIFRLDRHPVKTLFIKLNPNEVRAVKMLLSINDFLDLPPYELATVSDFFSQVHKIETNILYKSFDLKDNMTFEVKDTAFGQICSEIEEERY